MGLPVLALPRRRILSSIAISAALPLAAQAAAQVGPIDSATPTREEIEQQAPAAPVPPAARLTVEGDIERAPCALDRPEYRDIKFTPTEVLFEDLKGLSPQELRPAYAPFLGTEQSVAIVCEIRDRAATILRDAGYIASVEVPEQRIADGRLRFQVLMAKMVAVRVRGDAGRAERQIASYLQRLTEDEVFNRFSAERALLLAGDLPGYSVRLALRSAGAARGEVIGEVTVLRTPFMVDANIQNYGSHELGRWGAMLRGQLFGLTGLGDRTTASLFSTLDTDEQQTLQLGHDFKLGSQGLTLGGQFTYSWTRPDIEDLDLDIRGRTLFATIQADYPLIRSIAQNIRAGIGLDIVNQDVDFAAAGSGDWIDLSRDRLRVGFLRLTADAIDSDFSNRAYTMIEPRWRMKGDVELRRGLDILGASEDCRPDPTSCVGPDKVPPSRLGGDPTATVLRASVYGEFRPMPRLAFAGGMRGQHSGSPLYSFEEFSAGNYTIGRGYDAGSIAGDRGFAFQAEVRVGSLVPRTAKALALEPYVFVDQAYAWGDDLDGSPLGRRELTSVGGGLRASIGDQFSLEATLAAPLDRLGPGNKPDPRLLFSFSSRLWPWSFR